MIQVQKTKDKVILFTTTELDYEDVQDLVLDLQNWLIENNKEDHTKSKAYQEAKEQNQSKNKLAADMRRCFVDILDSEWIQKELTTYELDPKDRAIIVKKTKLKDEKYKRVPSKEEIETFSNKVTNTAEEMGIGWGDAFASDWGEDNWIADYLADNSLRKEKDGKKGI